MKVEKRTGVELKSLPLGRVYEQNDIYTALLVYVLLRFMAHLSAWGHSFTRLFAITRLLGICFFLEAPERAIGLDRRAGKREGGCHSRPKEWATDDFPNTNSTTLNGESLCWLFSISEGATARHSVGVRSS